MTDDQFVTLAHLSDIHLPAIAGLPPQHWSAKRALGYLNWHHKRHRMHTSAAIEAIVCDVRLARPDHIVITGDIANLGLPAELEAGRAWLASLGGPGQVSVVPGNHDVYVPMRRDPGIGRWLAFMTSFASPREATAGAGEPSFPFVRRLRHVALIGLNSAIPTPVFVAAGRLGAAQLAATAEALQRLGAEGLVRIVLIHHPPLPGQATHRRALADAAELAEVLRVAGAEIVLHGHNHCNSLAWAAGPAGPIPVVGIASASASLPIDSGNLARYNLVQVSGRGPAARIQVIGRALDRPGPGARVIEVERTTLAAGRRVDE